MLTSRASTSCSTSRSWPTSTATLDRGRGPDRVAVLGGHDQAEQQAAQLGALGGVHRVVEGLGGPGDGLPDPAGGPVARDGQGRALAALPGLSEHVGEQRQRGGLTLDLADEQVDQPGFEPEPGAAGRTLDRAAQSGLAHRAEQVQAFLQHAGDLRVRRQVAQVVGPQRQHQRPAGADVQREGREVPGSFGRIGAESDRLLGLVHHQRLSPAWLQGDDRVHRVHTGRGDEHRGPAPEERGHHPGPHQGGLAHAGRPDHGEHARVAQPAQAGGDVVLATEERVRVGGVVGQQAAVGTGRPDLR